MTKTALILIPGILTSLLLPTAAHSAVCTNQQAIAHRGGTESYVENTRKAWNDSMNHGIRWVETDVRFAKTSDIPMIMHDATVDRTTNGTGTVASKTYTQLRKYRTSDGQYIPTLWETLEDVRGHGARAIVELKTVPNSHQWGMLKSRVDGTGMRSRVLIASFNKDVVKAARSRGYTVAWIDQWYDRSVSSVESIVGNNGYYMKYAPALTKDRVARWKAGGLKVFPWTANTESDWPRLKGYKLPGIITDKPKEFRNSC